MAGPLQQLEKEVRSSEGGGRNTSQRDLSPVGFPKPKGRQASLVSRDYSK